MQEQRERIGRKERSREEDERRRGGESEKGTEEMEPGERASIRVNICFIAIALRSGQWFNTCIDDVCTVDTREKWSSGMENVARCLVAGTSRTPRGTRVRWYSYIGDWKNYLQLCGSLEDSHSNTCDARCKTFRN